MRIGIKGSGLMGGKASIHRRGDGVGSEPGIHVNPRRSLVAKELNAIASTQGQRW